MAAKTGTNVQALAGDEPGNGASVANPGPETIPPGQARASRPKPTGPEKQPGRVMVRSFGVGASLPDRRRGEKVRKIRGYEAELVGNWMAEFPEGELRLPSRRVETFVLDYHGVVVAACSLLACQGDVVWLGGLLVPERFRGRGFGLSMLAGFLERLEDGRNGAAAALVTDARARSTFRATGFTEGSAVALPLVVRGLAPYVEWRGTDLDEMQYKEGCS